VGAHDRLSERQRQCLDGVAKGMTSKQIARDLGLSPSTVDNHIRLAIERLGAPDRAAAAQMLRGEVGTDVHRKSVPQKYGLFTLPPLGGVKNELDARQRVFHIVQIALLGIMGMAAAVITIAGLVNLFGR
jgi:DNA-binding CsgD family transcriptional regulator